MQRCARRGHQLIVLDDRCSNDTRHIAAMLGKNEAAVRQITTRARERVRVGARASRCVMLRYLVRGPGFWQPPASASHRRNVP